MYALSLQGRKMSTLLRYFSCVSVILLCSCGGSDSPDDSNTVTLIPTPSPITNSFTSDNMNANGGKSLMSQYETKVMGKDVFHFEFGEYFGISYSKRQGDSVQDREYVLAKKEWGPYTDTRVIEKYDFVQTDVLYITETGLKPTYSVTYTDSDLSLTQQNEFSKSIITNAFYDLSSDAVTVKEKLKGFIDTPTVFAEGSTKVLYEVLNSQSENAFPLGSIVKIQHYTDDTMLPRFGWAVFPIDANEMPHDFTSLMTYLKSDPFLLQDRFFDFTGGNLVIGSTGRTTSFHSFDAELMDDGSLQNFTSHSTDIPLAECNGGFTPEVLGSYEYIKFEVNCGKELRSTTYLAMHEGEFLVSQGFHSTEPYVFVSMTLNTVAGEHLVEMIDTHIKQHHKVLNTEHAGLHHDAFAAVFNNGLYEQSFHFIETDSVLDSSDFNMFKHTALSADTSKNVSYIYPLDVNNWETRNTVTDLPDHIYGAETKCYFTEKGIVESIPFTSISFADETFITSEAGNKYISSRTFDLANLDGKYSDALDLTEMYDDILQAGMPAGSYASISHIIEDEVEKCSLYSLSNNEHAYLIDEAYTSSEIDAEQLFSYFESQPEKLKRVLIHAIDANNLGEVSNLIFNAMLDFSFTLKGSYYGAETEYKGKLLTISRGESTYIELTLTSLSLDYAPSGYVLFGLKDTKLLAAYRKNDYWNDYTTYYNDVSVDHFKLNFSIK